MKHSLNTDSTFGFMKCIRKLLKGHQNGLSLLLLRAMLLYSRDRAWDITPTPGKYAYVGYHSHDCHFVVFGGVSPPRLCLRRRSLGGVSPPRLTVLW